MNKRTWVAGSLGAVAIAAIAFFVFRPDGTAQKKPAAGGGAISVTTVAAARRDVAVTLETTGTVSALNSVEVRPQLSSTITKVHIKEGQFVQAGQLMFSLDSRTDEVNVTKARAQLAKDEAALLDARRQLARSKDLASTGFIAQGAVDTNQATVDAAQAVVDADRAAIKATQVDLGYTKISATTAGRAGAINVFAGSLVQPAGAPLVVLTQINPIAVSFNVPQRNLNDALALLRNGGGSVTATLPDARGALTGRLQFVDNSVDQSSGTVKAKAVFDNPQQLLWPGAYAPVHLVIRTLKDAIVIPQAAVIQGARDKAVYVVGADRKVALRNVEVLESIGEDAVVQGVNAGERVVIDGRQNLRPGAAVVERAASGVQTPSPASAGEGGGGGKSGAAKNASASQPPRPSP